MGKIKRNEWVWVAAFIAVTIFVTSIPYWVAETRQSAAWHFSGFVFGVEDGNSYIAKMMAGAQGAWLYHLVYSSEPQAGAVVYGFYLLLGKLVPRYADLAVFHGQLVTLYHVARLVCGAVLLLASYQFLAELLPFPRQRQLGLVLVALGGGLGWLLMILGLGNWFGSLPVDMISPEAYSFLILYGLPHLALARTLLLLGLIAYWRKRAVWAGLALLGVSLIQPLYVLLAWGLMALEQIVDFLRFHLHFSIRPRRPAPGPAKWQVALVAALISAPLVLYTLLAFNTDPVLRQWNAQNILPAPNPLHYLAGYLVLLIPGFPGWRALQRKNPAVARFCAMWMLVAPFLLYAPIPPQRRLIEGLQLPLVALAVWGITVFWRRWRRWASGLVVALSLPTTAILLLGGVSVARTPIEPVFHADDQVRAFAHLAQLATPGEVVLSAYETGNVLPAYAPLIAYIGHGPETVFLAQKQPRVVAFFSTATDLERRALLSEGNIRWVIVGPTERALGDFDPDQAPYLKLRPMADNQASVDSRYKIYEVAP